MAKKVVISRTAFGKARDALVVQSVITAAEFQQLINMLEPGMRVKNFVSGNTAIVRAICTEPGKPKFGYNQSPYLPVTRKITAGKRAGKVEEISWNILNVDMV